MIEFYDRNILTIFMKEDRMSIITKEEVINLSKHINKPYTWGQLRSIDSLGWELPLVQMSSEIVHFHGTHANMNARLVAAVPDFVETIIEQSEKIQELENKIAQLELLKP